MTSVDPCKRIPRSNPLFIMYTLSDLGSTIATAHSRIRQAVYRLTDATTNITDEDWDNLILLDACRYDQFQRLASMDSPVEPRISVGSSTEEFLRRTFGTTEHHDIVYVTANPMHKNVGLDGTFHATIDVWNTGWDETLRTVTPETVREAAVAASETFPQKRLLVHFMQPHYPFIGPTGREIEHAGFEWSYRLAMTGEGSRDSPTIWDHAEAGSVDIDRVWTAYDENLALALEQVDHLLEIVRGRTVVTADHGNFVGERIAPFDRRRFGHPDGVCAKTLRTVPWVVVTDETRKHIGAEPPTDSVVGDISTARSRLRDLGYV